MPLERWFLTDGERPGGGRAWTTGNQARPLASAGAYPHELLDAIAGLGAGDLLLYLEGGGAGTGVELVHAGRAARARGALVCGGRARSRRDRRRVVVLRHGERPARDVAYLGGAGAWLAVCGPAVGDVESAVRERWGGGDPLPPRLPDPPRVGTHAVQLLRTCPGRGRPGERSIARGYVKALRQAGELIYVEDRCLWSARVAAPFAEALARRPELRMIAVLPPPERGDRLRPAARVAGRRQALAALHEAGGARVAAYWVEDPGALAATVCVIDDIWAMVGAGGVSLRAWTRDVELSAAVVDRFTDAPGLPATLRLALAAGHLGHAGSDSVDLRDGPSTFTAFALAADALDAWHASGRPGRRPPGRLRHYRLPPVPAALRPPARLLYHGLYDRDGRPRQLRRAGLF
jgi:hypothetical protein